MTKKKKKKQAKVYDVSATTKIKTPVSFFFFLQILRKWITQQNAKILL